MGKGNAVRLGLIGLGSFSVVIAGAVERSRKAELVTCYDVIAERRRAARQRFGCTEAGTLEEVLRRADDIVMRHPAYHAKRGVLVSQHSVPVAEIIYPVAIVPP